MLLIVDALKAIIDLLHKRDENAKVRVETEIAKHDLAQRTRVIETASMEDIERYDPTVQRIRRAVRTPVHWEPAKSSTPHVLLYVLITTATLAAILVGVYLYLRTR